MSAPETIIHASCVSIGGRAVLIVGPSGSGKSALALQLMAFGGTLVADDQTHLSLVGTDVVARSPAAIAGMVESRGMGLFQVADIACLTEKARIAFVVDLGSTSTERMPQPRTYDLLGVTFPCYEAVRAPHFVATILLILRQTLTQRP